MTRWLCLDLNITQDPRFKGIPVIIHSSLTGSTNERHVKSVGADAHIAKFVAEELAATIREALANAGHRYIPSPTTLTLGCAVLPGPAR